MTPEEALALAKAVSDTYSDATSRLLALIAERLAKGLDRPRWADERLAELIRLRRNAHRIVAAMQDHGTSEVLRILEDAYRGGRLIPLTSPGMTGTPQRAVAALAADTVRTLESTTPRILRWTEDTYRRVIADTIAPTVVGVTDRREAAARALDRFAAIGVDGFRDTAGRNWRLESYTEMATRTATGQAHLAGTLDRYTSEGRDLVIVSDSPEECSLCRPFEGNVLSISGAGGPTDLPAGIVYMGSLADARSRGLFHPNCTHRANAYTPGLTTPNPGTENPQGYEDRQRQRELERRVRESKRRVAALEPLGDTTTLRRQQALLRQRRAALSQHVTETGRKAHVSARRTSLGAL